MGKKVNRHPNFLITMPDGRPAPDMGAGRILLITLAITLLDINVFGIAAQDKQGHGAEPDFAVKTRQISHRVGRTAGQRVLTLHQASIARLLKAPIAGHVCGYVVL